MPTPSAIVRADKATKVYQRDSIPVPALHETSVEILEGDFVALVGPSGSGKTTLLNLIGGLDRPTSGRIWVGAQEITSLGRKALAEVRLRHIGFVFQEYNLVPVLSALENVEVPAVYSPPNDNGSEIEGTVIDGDRVTPKEKVG